MTTVKEIINEMNNPSAEDTALIEKAYETRTRYSEAATLIA